MERQYEYFAIVTRTRPTLEDPASICRRWVDEGGRVHEEEYTGRLLWAPSTVLSGAGSGTGEAHRIDAGAAARFQRSLRDRVLRQEYEEDGLEYSYLAWVDWGATADDPTGLLRTWQGSGGIEREQRYLPGTGWRRSYVLEDWHRGRQDGRFDRIDQATAQRIIQRWEQRRAE